MQEALKGWEDARRKYEEALKGWKERRQYERTAVIDLQGDFGALAFFIYDAACTPL